MNKNQTVLIWVLVCIFCVCFFVLFCLLLLTWIGLAGRDWLLHLVWCAPLSFALPYVPLPLLVFWQASVNCPLPMVKLLQTPRCYDAWRHLWVAPSTKPPRPWPEWERKTRWTPAKPTSMYPPPQPSPSPPVTISYQLMKRTRHCFTSQLWAVSVLTCHSGGNCSSLVIFSRSLAEACSDGDVNAVRKLLDEGRSVNEHTEEGESLLCLACSAGYYELAQVTWRYRDVTCLLVRVWLICANVILGLFFFFFFCKTTKDNWINSFNFIFQENGEQMSFLGMKCNWNLLELLLGFSSHNIYSLLDQTELHLL